MDVKKAEHQRIDAFELWCWRRLLRVLWTARRSNQSILQGDPTSPGCSLEGLMLRLKLQYFGHLMWRADSFEKTLMLGGIGGRRRRGWQRMRWLDGITDLMHMTAFGWTLGAGDGQGGLVCCGSWGCKESELNPTNWIHPRKLLFALMKLGQNIEFSFSLVRQSYLESWMTKVKQNLRHYLGPEFSTLTVHRN